MNTLEPPKQTRPTHLLDAVRTFWLEVGSDLDDSELTLFLREAQLPGEAGFAFLGFSGGNVTFTVPKQDPGDWYSVENWIVPIKENIARAIAKKYHLVLYKPVDGPLNFHPDGSLGTVHHHLVMADPRQTVIVVHPLFLKIRLFGKPADLIYGRDPHYPLHYGPDLLQDLSRLYRTGPPE